MAMTRGTDGSNAWADSWRVAGTGTSSSVRHPAWKESLKRIRNGEARDRMARASRKEMEGIKAAKQVQAREYADVPKVSETLVNEAVLSLRALAIDLERQGKECTAKYLRSVARTCVGPLREDIWN